jgi:hypothetical protein
MNEMTVPFKNVKEELLRDPEVRAEYEALELAYQAARLRIAQKLTQANQTKKSEIKRSKVQRPSNQR